MNGERDFFSPEHRAQHRRWDIRFKVFLVCAVCALLFAAFYPI